MNTPKQRAVRRMTARPMEDDAGLDFASMFARSDYLGLPGGIADDLFDVDEAEEDDEGLIECVLVPLRDMVIFPHMVTPLFVGRERSVQALRAAHENEETVIVTTQRDAEKQDPRPEDLYEWGCEIVIGRILQMPDGSTSALAQGRRRVQIMK